MSSTFWSQFEFLSFEWDWQEIGNDREHFSNVKIYSESELEQKKCVFWQNEVGRLVLEKNKTLLKNNSWFENVTRFDEAE